MRLRFDDFLTGEANYENTIFVWRFHQAPQKFKELSTHGGDEDWLAFVPNTMSQSWGYIPWLDSGSRFGVSDVSRHQIENGVVYIGAHA